MGNKSTEELARQLGSAFAAAFPTQAPTPALAEAQSAPQSNQAVAPTVGTIIRCAYCKCNISESLTTRLQTVPQEHAVACPACTASSMVKTIKKILQRLTDRGGVFASKEQRTEHNKIRRDWRNFKKIIANAVAKWEGLANDVSALPEDLANIKRALSTWDKHRMELSEIPGVSYLRDVEEKEPTKEEHEIARLTMELLRLILEKEMVAEETLPQSASRQENLSAPRDPPLNIPSTPQGHAYRDEIMVSQAAIASTPPPTSSAPGTPKSILKRKASITLPKTPSGKRIRISDTVTISPPHLNVSNPSPFTKLPDTVDTQAHAPHTSAEQQRQRLAFKRSTAKYSPGVWASGAFEAKARTSNFHASWDSAESHVMNELKEAEAEQDVFKVIKAVSGTWLGVWWIHNVTRHIRLEHWEEKMKSQ